MARQIERSASGRRGEALASILRSLRHETRMPQMMIAGLDAVMAAMRAEGLAVVRIAGGEPGAQIEVLHQVGVTDSEMASAAGLLLRAAIGVPSIAREPDGRPVIAAICRHGGGAGTLGLVAWRRRRARGWNAEDASLIDAVAGIVMLLCDIAAGAHHVAEASRADTLTALLGRRAFSAAAKRHIARLDRDGLPGTLLLAEVDNLDGVIEALGAYGGDQVLRRAAILLRSAVRPNDIVARWGTAEFAVWLSGADYMTTAERAEALCLEAPRRIVRSRQAVLPDVSFSIGIATHHAGESFDDLVRRAGKAVQEVKHAGGGYWRVSLERAA